MRASWRFHHPHTRRTIAIERESLNILELGLEVKGSILEKKTNRKRQKESEPGSTINGSRSFGFMIFETEEELHAPCIEFFHQPLVLYQSCNSTTLCNLSREPKNLFEARVDEVLGCPLRKRESKVCTRLKLFTLTSGASRFCWRHSKELHKRKGQALESMLNNTMKGREASV
ncbi:hypothetical protein VNO77_19340 [Canavalia gladiata]|uniref:Uncharacterized protein n=1 Tax=Canavalia gladiata TaxID=3824 RepID=A0AAN9LMH2_CANGL